MTLVTDSTLEAVEGIANGSTVLVGPVMATAAATTIAQVTHVVEVGDLDPEVVVTPGIYVDRIVQVTRRRP